MGNFLREKCWDASGAGWRRRDRSDNCSRKARGHEQDIAAIVTCGLICKAHSISPPLPPLVARSRPQHARRSPLARGGGAFQLDQGIAFLDRVLHLCGDAQLADRPAPAARRVADAMARPPAARQRTEMIAVEDVRYHPLDVNLRGLPVPLGLRIFYALDCRLHALLWKFGVPERRRGDLWLH